MLYKSLREWCQALIKKRKSKELRAALRTLSPLEREFIETRYLGKPSRLRLSEEEHKSVLETACIKLGAFLEQCEVKALEDRRKHKEQALRERVRIV